MWFKECKVYGLNLTIDSYITQAIVRSFSNTQSTTQGFPALNNIYVYQVALMSCYLATRHYSIELNIYITSLFNYQLFAIKCNS